MLVHVADEWLDYPETMPSQIQLFLCPDQWQVVCATMARADSDAVKWSCCIEVGVSLFGLVCIFCCHPLIVDRIREPMKEKQVRKLNIRLFQGRPVLSRFESGLMIDTSFIDGTPNGTTVSAQPAQMAMPLSVDESNPLKDIPLEM